MTGACLDPRDFRLELFATRFGEQQVAAVPNAAAFLESLAAPQLAARRLALRPRT